MSVDGMVVWDDGVCECGRDLGACRRDPYVTRECVEADAEMAGFYSESQTKEKQFSQMETDEVIEAELAKMKASKSKKKEG